LVLFEPSAGRFLIFAQSSACGFATLFVILPDQLTPVFGICGLDAQT
jgi:hypothetical protein